MSTGTAFATWEKSTKSGGTDNCVEVAFAADGRVGVRHSRNPAGPMLEFTRGEWVAFIDGVAGGELRGLRFAVGDCSGEEPRS